MGRCGYVAIVGALVGSGIAHAQPPPDQPVEPAPPTEPVPVTPPAEAAPQPAAIETVETAPAGTYPVSLTARQLLLPNGVGEAALAFRHQRSGSSGDSSFTTSNVEPRLRYGAGPVELEGAAGILVHHSEPDLGGPIILSDPETLSFMFAAVRYGLTPDLAVGGTLNMREPTADGTQLSPRAIIEHKLHLAPGAAIVLGLGLGLDHFSSDAYDQQNGVLEGELAVQAQVAPQLAFEGRAALHYIDPFDGGPMLAPNESYMAQDFGLRIVIGLSPVFDAVAGFDLLASGQGDVKLYTIGVAARRLP